MNSNEDLSSDSDDEELESKEDGDSSSDEKEDLNCIQVVKGKKDGYDCPTLILSEQEEKRIRKPWKHGVIVKLLGRKIVFKALETRLCQMWVKRGVLNLT